MALKKQGGGVVTTPPLVIRGLGLELNILGPHWQLIVPCYVSGEIMCLISRYFSHLHFNCEDYIRLGLSGDGGWDVCLVEPYRFAKPCLVYSFGFVFQ